MIAIYLMCLFVYGYSLVLPKDNTPHPCDGRNCSINITCGRREDKPDTCICMQGYRDDDCHDIDECNRGIHDPCGHRGSCTNTIGGYRCDCIQGWTDPAHHCGKNTTANPGCMPGYFGTNCTQTRCGHGYAVNNNSMDFPYWCKCSRGWRNTRPQDSCNIDIDECKGISNPCQQTGNCTNTQGSYKCSCSFPWHGKHCDVYDVCKTVSCDYNNTVCVKTGISHDSSYNCSCTEGWEGDKCTHKIIQTTPYQETTVDTTFVTTPDQETTMETTFVTTPDQESTVETTFVTTPDQETTVETTFVTTPDQETTVDTTFVTTPDQETTMETTFVTTPDEETTAGTIFVTTPDQETTIETTFGTIPDQKATVETTFVITPDQETTMGSTFVSKAVQTIEETFHVSTVTPDEETTYEQMSISTLIKGTNSEWTTHEDRVSEAISQTDNTDRGGTGVPVIVGAVIGSVAVVTLVVVSSVLMYRYNKRVRVEIGDLQDEIHPQILLKEGDTNARFI